MKKPTINTLTSLRFIAAVAVFAHHLSFFDTIYSHLALYTTYLINAYVAVTVFFVISGFVISYHYFDKITAGSFSLRRYMYKRLVRLVPLHELTVLISIPLTVYGQYGFQLPVFLATIFLVHGFIPKWDYLLSYTRVSWMLSSFLFCYLLFPFVVLSIKKLAIVSLRQIIISLLCLWFFYFVLIATIDFGAWPNSYFWLYILPFCRLPEFISGILLWKLWQKTKDIHVPFPHVVALIAEVGVLLVLILFFKESHSIPAKFKWSFYYLPPFSLMILVFAYGRGYISTVLSHPWLVELGDASFEFYLFQWIISQLYLLWLGPQLLISPIMLAFYAFLTNVVVSLIFHRIFTYVEAHLM